MLKIAVKGGLACALALSCGVFSHVSYASGFQLGIVSADSMGRSNAGEVAGSTPMVTKINPASLMLLDGTQLSHNSSALYLDYSFDIKQSPYDSMKPTLLLPNGYASRLSTDSGPAGTKIIVPSFAYTKHLGEWAYGVSAGPHFAYEFDPKKLTKAAGTFGDFYIKSVHLTGNVAHRLSDALNVGLGVSVVPTYLKVDRRFGELGYLLDDINNNTGGVIGGILKPLTDPSLKVVGYKGFDVGLGWNLGLTYQPSDAFRFAAVYHDKTTFNFKGDYVSDIPKSVALPFGVNLPLGLDQATGGQTIDADSPLTFPNWFEVGSWHKLSDRWDLSYGVRWTGWEKNFKQLKFSASDGSKTGAEFKLETKNTFRYAVGVDHHLNDKWTLRGGVAMDQGYQEADKALHNSPDGSNRWWYSLGASYKTSEKSSWDVGLSYLSFDGDELNEQSALFEQLDDAFPSVSPSGLLGVTDKAVVSDYDLNIMMLSLQYNKQF